jgi:nitroreductase
MGRNLVAAAPVDDAQSWAFLALTEPADRARFWPYCPVRVERTPSMQNAPLVVVVLAHKQAYLDRYGEPDAEDTWPAPYWFVDAGMAALLILLSAVDEGLGACIFGIQKTYLGPLRAEFGIPEEYSPVGAITIGYRAADLPPQDPRMTAHRRPMADVVHRGHWGG